LKPEGTAAACSILGPDEKICMQGWASVLAAGRVQATGHLAGARQATAQGAGQVQVHASAGRRAGAGAQHAAQERQGNLGRLQHCGREQAAQEEKGGG